MAFDTFPITPPPELVLEWQTRLDCPDEARAKAQYIAAQTARWGADQELNACCADIHMVYGKDQADWLRSLRRPKPPSLKEQALDALDEEQAEMTIVSYKTIRAALETLPND